MVKEKPLGNFKATCKKLNENNFVPLSNDMHRRPVFSKYLSKLMNQNKAWKEIKDSAFYDKQMLDVWLKKDCISSILHTDTYGGDAFLNSLSINDSPSGSTHVSLSSLMKELSKRIQEPRESLKTEKYLESEKYLRKVRDNHVLKKMREFKALEIQKEETELKAKMRKDKSINCCKVSGLPLDDFDVHHIERKADKPHKAAEPENCIPVKKSVHKQIHNEQANCAQELNAFQAQHYPNMVNFNSNNLPISPFYEFYIQCYSREPWMPPKEEAERLLRSGYVPVQTFNGDPMAKFFG